MKKIIAIVILMLLTCTVIALFIFLTRNQKSMLVVQSNYPASVYIDGKVVGATPFEQQMKTGSVILKLEAQQGAELLSYETKVTLEPNVKTIIQRRLAPQLSASSGAIFTLKKKPFGSTITIVTVPNQARVMLNKQDYGLSPVNVPTLESGNYILRVVSSGFVTYETVIQSVNGYETTAFIELEKIKAELPSATN